MTRKSRTSVYAEEARWFYGALATLFIIFIAYVYFVSISVADVVMRKEMDTHIADMNAEISNLESTYIELQQSVSGELALEKGYVLVSSKIFIDKSEDRTLVLRNN